MISALRGFLPVFLLVVVFSGCAGLPARVEMSDDDGAAAGEAFKKMVERQRYCDRDADAELIVTIVSPFFRGTMNGYMHIMAPSFIKLVGMNPLGQPLAVLVSDGENFTYSALSEKIVYEGKVDSETYRRYAPAGLDTDNIFYVLIGKLSPGEVRILSTGRDARNRGVWLDLRSADESRSLVLFDVERQVVLRHLRLDEDGRRTLDVTYEDYGTGSCGFPGRITASSHDHNGELTFRLTDWRTGFSSSSDDFELNLPPDFKRVKVN